MNPQLQNLSPQEKDAILAKLSQNGDLNIELELEKKQRANPPVTELNRNFLSSFVTLSYKDKLLAVRRLIRIQKGNRLAEIFLDEMLHSLRDNGFSDLTPETVSKLKEITQLVPEITSKYEKSNEP